MHFCKIKFVFLVHIILSLVIVINCDTENNEVHVDDYFETVECKLPNRLKKEIRSYKPIVDKIINAATAGEFRGKTWNYLVNFVDKFGNRIAGSRNLENAIDYMLNMSEKHGLENVHGENVTVPRWIRGKENAFLLRPHTKSLPMLGLGGSIATPRRGIIAPVLVVKSFDELKQKAQEAKGKIVVFNEPYVSYGETVQYRSYGAVEAAKLGAVATLIRSVTQFSIASPHTGWQDYNSNVTKIPTACITIEDAEMLNRMYDRGEKILIYLYMAAQTLPDTVSRNTVAEIQGAGIPEKVVIVSGHLDSWDVGEGAMDDGGGAFISWCSLVLLKSLGLRPKRTVRAVLWTAEEEGLIGAIQYAAAHANETQNFDLVMESDEGTFTPLGLEFSGPNKSACIMQHILKGKEQAYLLRPQVKVLPMLGLGSSIATPRRGIIAPVLVVKSFDELKQKAQEAKGKIVVFNEPYVRYSETVKYRNNGAVEAARFGAVATLIRSVTPFSIASPHTGKQNYHSNVTKIPTACITVEDAQMLNRMYDRGENILIYLYMEAHTLPDTVSRNAIAEIKGTVYPEKVVIVSGHLDSWDVGEGALDDGGGAFISWSSLVLLKSLGLQPKRTVRAILWTAEEEGLIGAKQYAAAHVNETKNFNLVMESDEGTFTPLGLDVTAPNMSACIMQHILYLTASINTTKLTRSQGGGGPDISVWTSNKTVPGATLLNDNQHYFWFHHSDGDTMAVQDPTALDKATALWAAVAYVVADLKHDLQKK